MGARIKWFVRQLTPRTYWTTYGEVIDNADGTHGTGPEHFVIWKMWLGHCYDVIDFSASGVATMGNARAACYPLPKN